jgi:hypothetical protein
MDNQKWTIKNGQSRMDNQEWTIKNGQSKMDTTEGFSLVDKHFSVVLCSRLLHSFIHAGF